ncbi:uncharacterized protein LOC129944847 [Eupeodes corollae]|uniref:uncharacterized protein LOC129944847 n=1 Tax=Eupeodes corollae TaxID=290404 RepID=UPI00248F7D95|nr:uncharacterized protein LOC129944847 [Eupeodes corollae]
MLQPLIEGIGIRKFVIIYGVTLNCLQKYFTFFDTWKFTRIFGIAENNVSYAFLPYADTKIQSFSRGTASLPNALNDLNGFTLRTAMTNDIPRCFRYRNLQGIEQFGGFAPQIVLAFLRRHNATLKEVQIFNSTHWFSFQETLDAILNHTIDISMNASPSFPEVFHISVKSLIWTLIVPLLGYIDPNEYFQRPFSLEVWILIGLTGIYIAVVDFGMKKLINSQADIRKSLSETFLAFLMKPSEGSSTTAYRIKIQVFIFCFVLGSMYMISVTSFLTAFIRIKQMETMQDLIDHNIPIMMSDFSWKYMHDYNASPPGFEKIVKLVEFSLYMKEIDSMNNTKFGYSSAEDRTEFLFGLQKHFNQPLLFRSIPYPNIKYHIGFILDFHSPFRENLVNLVERIKEVGLIQKWDFDTTINSINVGYRMHKSGLKLPGSEPVAIKLDTLQFAWNCLAKGLALASVVFVGEILVKIVKMRKYYWIRLILSVFNK